jgi:hypothetical protein
MFDRGLKTHIIATRTVRRTAAPAVRLVHGDICVLGAGIAGVAAALEAAKLGRRVVLVDGAPSLGGQAVGSIIGTLIGLYTHGPNPYQLTHGIADELIRDLQAEGALLTYRNVTVTFQYDELRLARWIERQVQAAGIQALVGAVLTDVGFAARRITHLDLATRFGPVRVAAQGFVDASGDATLAWHAGLAVREPEEPIFGTLNFLIEGFDTRYVGELKMPEVHARLRERGREYGLVRHDGHLMTFASRGFMLANISHFETPLDPLASAALVFEGRRQADATLAFLRQEFPRIFAQARIRAYGNPGIRQTRWIVGRSQLTQADIHAGRRHADAVARCAWWVELHNTAEQVHWERMPDAHVYTIPLSCMTPAEADNLVAAGRCVDGDSHALSAVRVMGPCIAMGTAAAHALDLAAAGPVHALDLAALQRRLYDNLERRD